MSIGPLKHAVICVFVLALAPGFVEAVDKPNIVVFLTDDLGYGDLGCYGSESLETPNIDRLCQQGMKFTDFYVHQRCSPTRLAFMTGSHAHRAGFTKVIYNRDKIGIHADEVTTPELLKDDLEDVPPRGVELTERKGKYVDAILEHGLHKEGVRA